jgi:predicted GIY-YIG superfamily endonuclease
MFYVYILLCSNNKLYTGCTNNLKDRFQRHMDGKVESTKHILPVKLLFYCAFIDKWKAYAFEKYLKSGSGRAFKNKRLI